MIANDPASQRRTRSRQPCGSNRRQSGKREVRMGRVRRGDTVFHDFGCGYGQRLCGSDITSRASNRPVPCRLGLDCEEKCQKAEAEGKRSAPTRQGSGERSRHRSSLSCGCDQPEFCSGVNGRLVTRRPQPCASTRNYTTVSISCAAPKRSKVTARAGSCAALGSSVEQHRGF